MKKPGDTVDRYVLDALLGSGGMGEVYEARDTRLGRKVALKLLRPGSGDDADQRMLREARIAAAFEHPNAVVVFDVGEIAGERYIAMELVRGRSLRAFVGESAIPLARRLRWLVDTARALAAAHRAGLVHRDVKPDNVMVRDDGVVKVLDFGIARRTRQVDPSAPTEVESDAFATITAKGVVVGTPLYTAPEQLRSEAIDGRADQFAWGVMAYELCTGAPPWTATNALGLLSQILSGEVEPVRARATEVPEEVDVVVMRALSKRAGERFADMDAVADALEPFAEVAPSTARVPGTSASGPITGADAPTTVTPRPSRTRKALRWGFRIGVAIFALPGVLIFGALFFGAVTGKLQLQLPGHDAGADAGPLVVDALACSDAKVDGPAAFPALAHALGVGACARLAAELGVDWRGGAGSSTLAVSVAPADGGAGSTVRLELGGRSASSTALTPLDALVASVATLAKEVSAPPMPSAEVEAWGAKDAASARRIERVWRRMVLNVAPNDEIAIKEVLASDPDSPWPHAFEALTLISGSDALTAATDRAIARVDKLPPARALGLRGIMLYVRSSGDRKEALRLLRQSYADEPNDADIAGLYAAVAIAEGAGDEGFAVVDRLFARYPTRSIVPLNNAVTADGNPARDAKYLERLLATFPETSAWSTNVSFLVRGGRFDEARAALDFARTLGMNGATTDSLSIDASAAGLELAALAPAAARELASKMLADPRLPISSRGPDLTVASYLLEGRIIEAEATALREMDRQRDRKSPLLVASFGTQLLQLRRLLGRPPLDAEHLGFIDEALAAGRGLPSAARATFGLELALARGQLEPRRAKELAEAALRENDALAASEEDRRARDRILLVSLPLVRLLQGDREAVKRWQTADRAPARARARAALEAGLAFDGLHDPIGAEQAYGVATNPEAIDACPFAALVAMAKLAELHRARHHDAEAKRLNDLLGSLLANAEPGLRAALGRVR